MGYRSPSHWRVHHAQEWEGEPWILMDVGPVRGMEFKEEATARLALEVIQEVYEKGWQDAKNVLRDFLGMEPVEE